MNGQKLNNLYRSYRNATGEQKSETAREMYDELSELRSVNASSVRRSGGDDHDAQSVFHDVFFGVLQKDNVEDVTAIMSRSLKNRRANLFNQRKRTRKYPTLAIEEKYDEDDAATSVIVRDDFNLENHVMQKKEADKHELTDFLLESSQILLGAEMTAIIKALPDYDSINDAATSNGLHRNQLVRALDRISRCYVPKSHGDIRDYFPAGYYVKKQFIQAV